MHDEDPSPQGASALAHRGIILVICGLTSFANGMDITVLNVALPTIIRDFDSTLPSVQWVITGYSLTYASLLVIGGRLGDLLGHRRALVVGVSLFGVGSLLAALSQSVLTMVLGKAIFQGVGAALMGPASVAILSRTFTGHRRAKAFGLWGLMGGLGATVGPLVGGLFTEHLSWRWAFIFNVVLAPITIIVAMLVVPRLRPERKPRALDIGGAVMVAVGMACVIFGISEGERYGWLGPSETMRIGGIDVWPESAPVSIVVVSFVAGAMLLVAFCLHSLRKERRGTDPLFALSEFRNRTFGFGVAMSAAFALGQLTIGFILAVFLQRGRGLSPGEAGLWVLPTGIMFIVGTQVGTRLARRFTLVIALRIGIVVQLLSMTYFFFAIRSGLTAFDLVIGALPAGIGPSTVVPQAMNIVMTEVAYERAGAASGVLATARQLGNSIGIAMSALLLNSRTTSAAVSKVQSSPSLSADVKQAVARDLTAEGIAFDPGKLSPADATRVRHIFTDSLAIGSKWAVVYGAVVTALALLLSVFITRARRP